MILGDGETHTCTITRVFKGSPAEEAGVQRGDILYRVEDDLYVTAENLTEAVNIMRGEPGTSVNVTFLRNGEEVTYSITRKQINVNQIESTMLADGVGYIALYQFAGNCHKEFETALNQLVAQGAKGIIMDLRDNPGGWVDQAQYIADLFMDEGELCYLVYRDGIEHHEDYPTRGGKVDVALTILIKENSASSSEILTGALSDYGLAKVVGDTTFGKGIVQVILTLSDGTGLKVTMARYYTPNGVCIHGVGIAPDVEVKDDVQSEQDEQLIRALEVVKSLSK
jgi:carboxyl-terminal processing protease